MPVKKKMMSPFKLNICKRRIPFILATKKVPVLLPRNINTSIGSSSCETLFPSTMAVAGSLRILVGLWYLVGFSFNGSSAMYRRTAHETKEQHELKSEISLDLNGFSATSIASQREEREPSVLKMLKPMVRPVPALSCILQSQVFGSGNFRCITKLEGIDVVPKKSSSPCRAKEQVYTHGTKSWKNKGKQHKSIPPQISTTLNDKKVQKSETAARKTGPERELSNGISHDVVLSVSSRTKEPKTEREVPGSAGIGSSVSGEFQGQTSDANVKKPRKRLNRKPRPRHRKKAQKSARQTVQQSKNAVAECNDDRTSADFVISESDPAQKRRPGLSRAKKDAWKYREKHLARKESSTFESERTHSQPAEHKPGDSEPTQGGKKANARCSSGMRVPAEESTFSTANKPFENALSNEEGQHRRASSSFTSQDVRSDNTSGSSSQRRRLKKAFRGDNPIRGDRLHPPGDPSRRMPRKYHSRRRCFDLDNARGGNM